MPQSDKNGPMAQSDSDNDGPMPESDKDGPMAEREANASLQHAARSCRPMQQKQQTLPCSFSSRGGTSQPEQTQTTLCGLSQMNPDPCHLYPACSKAAKASGAMTKKTSMHTVTPATEATRRIDCACYTWPRKQSGVCQAVCREPARKTSLSSNAEPRQPGR